MQKLKEKNIIMVDDDIDTLEILGDTLKHLFGNVHLFESPKKAIDFLKEREHEIDVIISDLNMPGMDGMEFFSFVRKMGISAYLMLITANQDLEITDKMDFLYLKKPISLRHFKEQLSDLFADTQ